MKTYKFNYEIYLRPSKIMPVRLAHYKKNKGNLEIAKRTARAISVWDTIEVQVWVTGARGEKLVSRFLKGEEILEE